MIFEVSRTSSRSLARIGVLQSDHGEVATPVFMPLATSGAVKTLSGWEVEELGAQIVLGNTYHLHLRPGEKLIARQGGLHRWMSWNGAILTDSGGFQAFSLGESRAKKAKTDEDGVTFYSHLDGRQLRFTSESVLDIQLSLGSDIVMVLDDCPPYPASRKRLDMALSRTAHWAEQSISYWRRKRRKGKAIFGIVQGGVIAQLRRRSLQQIQQLPFDGLAIGGVSVGEGKAKMEESVEAIASELDPNRPHYLMGVGEPVDLIRMVARGIDMFDCVLPTRLARHGSFWDWDFVRHNLSQARFKADKRPLDERCRCRYCQRYSRSYLAHLLSSGEVLGIRALSYHNLFVYLELMKKIRLCIAEGSFERTFHRHLS